MPCEQYRLQAQLFPNTIEARAYGLVETAASGCLLFNIDPDDGSD